MLHEAVFYFGDKRSRDFFNRPLCLSVDSLALNFSAGSGEEKLEKLIWAAWLHQGGGGGTKCIRMGRLWGERSLVASVPCAWHHSSQKMWDLSTSGSPAGHARRYQRTGDIFPPVHGDALAASARWGITLQDSGIECPCVLPAEQTSASSVSSKLGFSWPLTNNHRFLRYSGLGGQAGLVYISPVVG